MSGAHSSLLEGGQEDEGFSLFVSCLSFFRFIIIIILFVRGFS